MTGIGYEPRGAIELPVAPAAACRMHDFFAAGVLASNARLLPPDKDVSTWHVVGDPTEGALLLAARKAGLDLGAVLVSNTEVTELPFDSNRKLARDVAEPRAARRCYHTRRPTGGTPNPPLKFAAACSFSER